MSTIIKIDLRYCLLLSLGIGSKLKFFSPSAYTTHYDPTLPCFNLQRMRRGYGSLCVCVFVTKLAARCIVCMLKLGIIGFLGHFEHLQRVDLAENY